MSRCYHVWGHARFDSERDRYYQRCLCCFRVRLWKKAYDEESR